jgi:predicted metal-dependent hydrolase
MTQFYLDDIPVEVTHKKIKNLRLSVHPPAGKVKISAPVHMNLETIRIFAVSRIGWIKKHQAALKNREREAPRKYLDGESHSFLGKRYLLKLVAHRSSAGLLLKHETMELRVRGEFSSAKAKNALQTWYRHRLRELVAELVSKWEPVLGVKVHEFGIKLMKTKWGTCNPRAKRIWLNLELVKKPQESIEFVVVHEMAHLLVRKHGRHFKKIMDKHIPKWRIYSQQLRGKERAADQHG